MKKILFLILFYCSGQMSAQLANGSIAPDFTLNDINGNVHHLYDYLDQGKTVIIDCFATHCPSCWAYHNTHAVDNLYQQYGPNGTINQDIIVLAVEQDPFNGINELTGVSGYTQGNWLAGTSYPVINPEGADRTQFINDFSVNYYPLIYAICPNRTVKITGTVSTSLLYGFAEDCALTAGAEEIESAEKINFRYDKNTQILNIFSSNKLVNIRITDNSGKLIVDQKLVDNSKQITLPEIASGIYICSVQIETTQNGQVANEVSAGKFVVE